jgi:hypothetical protein
LQSFHRVEDQWAHTVALSQLTVSQWRSRIKPNWMSMVIGSQWHRAGLVAISAAQRCLPVASGASPWEK